MNEQENNSALAAFCAQLREFYLSCGEPSYKDLVETSEQLKSNDWYALPWSDRRDLPTLSKSAISEHLNGRRKRPPSADWLTAFILCCQRLAWELQVIPKDPGLDSLPEWHRKRHLALPRISPAEKSGRPGPTPNPRTAPQHQGRVESPRPAQPADEPGTSPDAPADPPDSPPSDRAGDDDDPAGPRAVMMGRGAVCLRAAGPAPARAAAVRAAVIESAVPVHLPARLREYVAGYGPYGSHLLAAAQDRIIDAVYRVAVLLLAADSLHGRAEAQRLLIYAAAAEHPAALELLDANPVRLDRLDAAAHACDLAAAAAAAGHSAAAMVFYECAARSGLPTASTKLAYALLAEGEEHQAVRWLALAAQQGDLRAEIRLETLRRAGRISSPPA